MQRSTSGLPAQVLVGCVIFLLTISTVMVYSAGAFYHHVDDPALFLRRQLLWLPLAVLCGVLFSAVDYRLYRRWYPAVLGVAALLLGLVLVPQIGRAVNNSRRWLSFGGELQFQPSELAKLAVVLFVAGFLANDRRRTRRLLRGFAPAAAGIFLLFGLILLEPNLGASVFVLSLGCGVMLIAGLRLRYLVACALLAAPVLALYVREHWDTVEKRLLGFLRPDDPAQHQVYHSLIALGTGHWTGVGLGASAEKLRYLPEAHTDFIFSVIGEELGFAGCVVIVALFVALVWSGARIALAARDVFGFLVASGITMALGFQALVNLAVVTGMAPTKGMSLPLVSFGGSGLCMTLAQIGILLSVAGVARREAPLPPPEDEPEEDDGHDEDDEKAAKARAARRERLRARFGAGRERLRRALARWRRRKARAPRRRGRGGRTSVPAPERGAAAREAGRTTGGTPERGARARFRGGRDAAGRTPPASRAAPPVAPRPVEEPPERPAGPGTHRAPPEAPGEERLAELEAAEAAADEAELTGRGGAVEAPASGAAGDHRAMDDDAAADDEAFDAAEPGEPDDAPPGTAEAAELETAEAARGAYDEDAEYEALGTAEAAGGAYDAADDETAAYTEPGAADPTGRAYDEDAEYEDEGEAYGEEEYQDEQHGDGEGDGLEAVGEELADDARGELADDEYEDDDDEPEYEDAGDEDDGIGAGSGVEALETSAPGHGAEAPSSADDDWRGVFEAPGYAEDDGAADGDADAADGEDPGAPPAAARSARGPAPPWREDDTP